MTDQAVNPGAGTGPLIDPTELAAIVTEILDVLVVNAGLELATPMPPEPGVEPTPLTSSIAVHADSEACLVIDTDAETGARLARCWGLVGPDGATRDDATDALGELCNLVGATVKSVFDEESHVGIPEVADGTGRVWDAVEATIEHTTGVFVARFGLL